jgi:hypothetical protein
MNRLLSIAEVAKNVRDGGENGEASPCMRFLDEEKQW